MDPPDGQDRSFELSLSELVAILEERVVPVPCRISELASLFDCLESCRVFLRHLIGCKDDCREKMTNPILQQALHQSVRVAIYAKVFEGEKLPDDLAPDGKIDPNARVNIYAFISPSELSRHLRRIVSLVTAGETIQGSKVDSVASTGADRLASYVEEMNRWVYRVFEEAMRRHGLDALEFFIDHTGAIVTEMETMKLPPSGEEDIDGFLRYLEKMGDHDEPEVH